MIYSGYANENETANFFHLAMVTGQTSQTNNTKNGYNNMSQEKVFSELYRVMQLSISHKM
jgi:hypothetical protein